MSLNARRGARIIHFKTSHLRLRHNYFFGLAETLAAQDFRSSCACACGATFMTLRCPPLHRSHNYCRIHARTESAQTARFIIFISNTSLLSNKIIKPNKLRVIFVISCSTGAIDQAKSITNVLTS